MGGRSEVVFPRSLSGQSFRAGGEAAQGVGKGLILRESLPMLGVRVAPEPGCLHFPGDLHPPGPVGPRSVWHLLPTFCCGRSRL